MVCSLLSSSIYLADQGRHLVLIPSHQRQVVRSPVNLSLITCNVLLHSLRTAPSPRQVFFHLSRSSQRHSSWGGVQPMGANRSRRRFGGACRPSGQGPLSYLAFSVPRSSHRRLSILSIPLVPLSRSVCANSDTYAAQKRYSLLPIRSRLRP